MVAAWFCVVFMFDLDFAVWSRFGVVWVRCWLGFRFALRVLLGLCRFVGNLCVCAWFLSVGFVVFGLVVL